MIMLLALYQQIINVFPGTHCQEVREVLYEVSRLFGTHPLQRSASASDKNGRPSARMGLAICCRMGGATSRSPKCGVASACGIFRSSCVLRAFSVRCSLRAEPKPRPSGKEGGKEKEWRCRVSPCTPTLSHLFLLLHFVVQHHLISAFTYGAYSSFIAHSFRGQ